MDPSSIGRPVADPSTSSTSVSRAGTPPPIIGRERHSDNKLAPDASDTPPYLNSSSLATAEALKASKATDGTVEMVQGDRLVTVNREWAEGVAEGEQRMAQRVEEKLAGGAEAQPSGTETPRRVEFEL